MANLFLAIPVPSADGPGAAVNILAFGWIKSFSLEGTLIGNVTLEISNDAITWAPLATLVVPGDICVGFASVFVRANVAGYISGSCVAAVGSDDLATLTAVIPVPPGNGTGAPVIVSALGQKKTVLYSGGPLYTDLSVIVEISEDGVTFSELAVFNGPTPASLSFECSIESMRTRVVGFVNGVVTVSVSAVNDPAGSGAFDTLQTAYDNSTGIPVDIQLDPALGGIRILDVAALTTPAFQVMSSASAQDSIRIVRAPAVSTGGDAISISMSGPVTGDGIDITLAPTAVTPQRGIRVSMTGGVNNTGSAIEIASNAVGAGSGVFVSMTGTQHAFQATMTGTGIGLVVTSTAVGAVTQCISLSASPAAASSIGGIAMTLGANNTGIPLNITSNGTGIAAVQIASSSTSTGNSLRIVHSGTGTVIDVTHATGAGNDFNLSRVPAVATAGNGFAITFGANTTGNPISITQSGSGRPIEITHSAGANSSIRLNRSPAVVTAGSGLDIIFGANTTGVPVLATSAGSGATAALSASGSGITLNMGSSGSGATLLATHTGTSTGPYFFGHSANTAGITVSISRTPTVATAGSIVRISSNPSFTGIGLELLMGGAGGTDAGMNMVVRGSGEGIGLFDQVPNTHTGTALRIQHSQTGSTGLLLSLVKVPAAATAGDIISVSVGPNASGITLSIAHAGTGNIFNVTGTAGAFALALLPGGQMQFANGTVGVPSISFNSSPTTGLIRSAAEIIGVSLAATERFQFTGTGTGEFIPPADNAGSVGSAARRFTLVRAVTITSGDLAFDDVACPRCGKEFQVEDEIVLKVHKIERDEAGRRVSYSVPQHANCGGV